MMVGADLDRLQHSFPALFNSLSFVLPSHITAQPNLNMFFFLNLTIIDDFIRPNPHATRLSKVK